MTSIPKRPYKKRRHTLPPMTDEQRNLYNKLLRNGIDKKEAMRVAMGKQTGGGRDE